MDRQEIVATEEEDGDPASMTCIAFCFFLKRRSRDGFMLIIDID